MEIGVSVIVIILFLYWMSMVVIHWRGLKFVPDLAVEQDVLADSPLLSIIIAAKDEED